MIACVNIGSSTYFAKSSLNYGMRLSTVGWSEGRREFEPTSGPLPEPEREVKGDRFVLEGRSRVSSGNEERHGTNEGPRIDSVNDTQEGPWVKRALRLARGLYMPHVSRVPKYKSKLPMNDFHGIMTNPNTKQTFRYQDMWNNLLQRLLEKGQLGESMS
ncbi:uncharacterized protein LOC106663418 isoform X2 [Cimex lectularius]|uniref:Uncharacterized protein n=1 Tax=Cimex lectularius TaxID=79782 RepID=A0A8I6REL6_CIMLE|nr:uncharacterized protein LOC106663418 isoform X2 [Cimex lectularius]